MSLFKKQVSLLNKCSKMSGGLKVGSAINLLGHLNVMLEKKGKI